MMMCVTEGFRENEIRPTVREQSSQAAQRRCCDMRLSQANFSGTEFVARRWKLLGVAKCTSISVKKA